MYNRRIEQARPGLIVMILDDSASMEDPIAGTSDQRYKWVERYTMYIFRELLARSTVMTGGMTAVKPRYFVYTLIYGTSSKTWPPGVTDAADIEQVFQAFTHKSEDGSEQRYLGLRGAMGGTHT